MDCACGLDAYRYVVVQFPSNDYANFCELEVYVHSKFLYGQITCIITCHCQLSHSEIACSLSTIVSCVQFYNEKALMEKYRAKILVKAVVDTEVFPAWGITPLGRKC